MNAKDLVVRAVIVKIVLFHTNEVEREILH